MMIASYIIMGTGLKDSEWVCRECYKRLEKEYECFTNGNYAQQKCFYCGRYIGEYHVINPPKKLKEQNQ